MDGSSRLCSDYGFSPCGVTAFALQIIKFRPVRTELKTFATWANAEPSAEVEDLCRYQWDKPVVPAKTNLRLVMASVNLHGTSPWHTAPLHWSQGNLGNTFLSQASYSRVCGELLVRRRSQSQTIRLESGLLRKTEAN